MRSISDCVKNLPASGARAFQRPIPYPASKTMKMTKCAKSETAKALTMELSVKARQEFEEAFGNTRPKSATPPPPDQPFVRCPLVGEIVIPLGLGRAATRTCFAVPGRQTPR